MYLIYYILVCLNLSINCDPSANCGSLVLRHDKSLLKYTQYLSCHKLKYAKSFLMYKCPKNG